MALFFESLHTHSYLIHPEMLQYVNYTNASKDAEAKNRTRGGRARGGRENRKRLGLPPKPYELPKQSADWIPFDEFNFGGLMKSIMKQSKSEPYQAYWGYYYNDAPTTGCRNFLNTPLTFADAVDTRVAQIMTTFYSHVVESELDEVMVDIIDANPHMCGVDIDRSRQSNGLIVPIIDENPILFGGSKKRHEMMYPWPIVYFGYPGAATIEKRKGVMNHVNECFEAIGEGWVLECRATSFAEAPTRRDDWQLALRRCPQKNSKDHEIPDLLYRGSYRIAPEDHALWEIWFRKVEKAEMVC